MASIPQKVADRIGSGLKRFQPILQSAHSRDVNESDTVVIVADILQYVLGFDKYSQITSEHAIRGTYCDLAIKFDGRLALLVEVKAIGLSLKDNHVKQAVDYAANQGCDWVVLTNGILWHCYRVSFSKPISAALVLDINLLDLNPRQRSDIELHWLMSKEGVLKSGLADYYSQREALSRFTLGALLTSDTVLDLLRRELRRVSPDANIETDEICTVLTTEVLKREVLEGDKAVAAKRLVSRAAGRTLRKVQTSVASDGGEPDATAAPAPASSGATSPTAE